MRKLYFLIALFIVGCSSDNNKEVLTIPLEYDVDKALPFEESGLDYSYEIIPLETDTSNVASFIGRSYRFIVYKDYIYFPDYSSAPKIFSTKGKFIKGLVPGRGPGEIGKNVNDIYIDRENDYFEVSDFGKISIFTLSGDFVSDEKNDEMCSDIRKFGDYTIVYDGIISHDSCFVKVINHRTGKLIHNLFPKNLDHETGWGLMANGVFMYNNRNIFFNIPYTDGIYKIEQGDSIPRIWAKFDNVLVYDKCPEFELWALEQYALSDKKNVYISNLSVSEDEQLISFRVNESRMVDKEVKYRAIYDMSQNKIFNYPVKMIDIVFSDGEYDYGMVFPEILDAQRDKFSESERPLMNKLCEYIDKNGVDTNPYVVKIKFFKK